MEAMALALCTGHGSSQDVLLRRMIEQDQSLLHRCRTTGGNSLLHCAALSGNLELVCLLVSKIPELCHERNAAGATALALAYDEPCRQVLSHAAGVEYVPVDVTEFAHPDLLHNDSTPYSLLALPEELQMQIFCHVDRDLKALLSLRQCSRRFKVRADNLRIAYLAPILSL